MEVEIIKLNIDFDYIEDAYYALSDMVEKDAKLANDFYNVIQLQNSCRVHSVVRSVANRALVISAGVALTSILIPELRGDIALMTAVGSLVMSWVGGNSVRRNSNKIAAGIVEMSDRTYAKLKLCKKGMEEEISEDEYIVCTTSVIASLLQDKAFCKKVEKIVKENRTNKNANNYSEM